MQTCSHPTWTSSCGGRGTGQVHRRSWRISVKTSASTTEIRQDRRCTCPVPLPPHELVHVGCEHVCMNSLHSLELRLNTVEKLVEERKEGSLPLFSLLNQLFYKLPTLQKIYTSRSTTGTWRCVWCAAEATSGYIHTTRPLSTRVYLRQQVYLCSYARRITETAHVVRILQLIRKSVLFYQAVFSRNSLGMRLFLLFLVTHVVVTE